MQDLNNNSIPDDGPWLELAGSDYNNAGILTSQLLTTHVLAF